MRYHGKAERRLSKARAGCCSSPQTGHRGVTLSPPGVRGSVRLQRLAGLRPGFGGLPAKRSAATVRRLACLRHFRMAAARCRGRHAAHGVCGPGPRQRGLRSVTDGRLWLHQAQSNANAAQAVVQVTLDR